MAGRPPVSKTISWIKDQGFYSGQISHELDFSGQEATVGDISVDAPVAMALSELGIQDLYAHQVTTIEAVRNGDNAVIATPTASGKTLTYLVPAVERAIDHGGKTLYIAPMRALINDQAATFREFGAQLMTGASFDVGVQTGETAQSERRQIKQSQPDVIMLTLDQVHYSLLPYAHSERNWRWLFEQLETVVIDEVHQYRGVFGSHAALIFRRLQRLCAYYETDVQFICCSATIGNPREHAAGVTGAPEDSFTIVDTDHSESGDRKWLLWNPPVKDDDTEAGAVPDSVQEAEKAIRDGESADTDDEAGSDHSPPTTLSRSSAGEQTTIGNEPTPADPEQWTAESGGERKSSRIEAMQLFSLLVARGYQTLAFAGARQAAEQLVTLSDETLRSWGEHELADKTQAYTAALNDDRRDEIERGLRDGSVRGVWSTKALELGIDIGSLDVVLLHGYPGTSMETFQRAGRAGRGDDDCLVVLVAGDNPLDQYIFRNPEELFETGAETATVNPRNDTILPEHVLCAAGEGYLSPAAQEYFGDGMPDIVTDALDNGALREVPGPSIQWAATGDPHWNMSIRSIDDREIALRKADTNTEIGSLEYESALRDAHPQAVYTYRKQPYRVTELDLINDVAYLEEEDTNGYTQPLREKSITLTETLRSQTIEPATVSLQATLAEMDVAETVTGYLEFNSYRDDDPTEHEFETPLPPKEISTTGLFIELPNRIEAEMTAQADDDEQVLAGLHALEHTLISLFPTEVLCDRRDIGGLSIMEHPQTTGGTVFVHDAHPGGAGLTRAAFATLPTLLDQAREVVACCRCDDGCPSCIHSPQCGNRNQNLDKERAIWLLKRLTVPQS